MLFLQWMFNIWCAKLIKHPRITPRSIWLVLFLLASHFPILLVRIYPLAVPLEDIFSSLIHQMDHVPNGPHWSNAFLREIWISLPAMQSWFFWSVCGIWKGHWGLCGGQLFLCFFTSLMCWKFVGKWNNAYNLSVVEQKPARCFERGMLKKKTL